MKWNPTPKKKQKKTQPDNQTYKKLKKKLKKTKKKEEDQFVSQSSGRNSWIHWTDSFLFLFRCKRVKNVAAPTAYANALYVAVNLTSSSPKWAREIPSSVKSARERLRGNVARSRVFLLFLLFLSFFRLYLLRRDSLDSHTHSSTIRISRVIGWEWWSIPAPRDWSNDVVRRYLSGGGQQLVDQLHVADHIVLVGLHF